MNPVSRKNNRKNGVALVIVLGLLSVLTTLAVAFAISMRVERMAAQNFADASRAEQLAQAAIARAMERVNVSMTTPPVTYPRWPNGEALGSDGTLACPDLLTGEALKAIPMLLQGDAGDVARIRCRWQDVPDGARRTNRIAYLIVNMSGLLDANEMGGTNRVWSKSLREIDIRKVQGVVSTNTFYTQRRFDRRYETLPELLAMNEGLDPEATEYLSVFSFDPGRDECFTNRVVKEQKLGCATTNDLWLKFDINAITNPARFPKDASGQYVINADFIAYTNRLQKMIQEAKISQSKPADVMWNIINWIDTDRYPQNSPSGNAAYVSTEGGEALPLINEIARLAVLSNSYTVVTNNRGVISTNQTGTATNCQAAVEIWYPFVVENEEWKPGGSVNYALRVFTDPAGGGFVTNIDPMAFGGASNAVTPEFRVFKGPVCPPTVTGIYAIVYENTAAEVQSGTSLKPVDSAPTRTGSPATPTYWYWPITGYYGIEIDDPRSNGKSTYWKTAVNEAGVQTNSIGRINYMADPWGTNTAWPQPNERQGVPIYVKNGPMENIAELGHIFLSNRENQSEFAGKPWKHFWCTIDLLSSDQGAYMLDYITTYPSNRAGRGFVTINALDPEQKALKSVFDNMTIGWTNGVLDTRVKLDLNDPQAQALVRDLTLKIWDRTTIQLPKGAISFDDLFKKSEENMNDDVRKAFRAFADWWSTKNGNRKPSDKIYEDVFRNIVELITFRQNIFNIIVAAQVMAPNGKTIEAEKRGIAMVYRDSYTGNYFVRSFKWLK